MKCIDIVWLGMILGVYISTQEHHRAESLFQAESSLPSFATEHVIQKSGNEKEWKVGSAKPCPTHSFEGNLMYHTLWGPFCNNVRFGQPKGSALP